MRQSQVLPQATNKYSHAHTAAAASQLHRGKPPLVKLACPPPQNSTALHGVEWPHLSTCCLNTHMLQWCTQSFLPRLTLPYTTRIHAHTPPTSLAASPTSAGQPARRNAQRHSPTGHPTSLLQQHTAASTGPAPHLHLTRTSPTHPPTLTATSHILPQQSHPPPHFHHQQITQPGRHVCTA